MRQFGTLTKVSCGGRRWAEAGRILMCGRKVRGVFERARFARGITTRAMCYDEFGSPEKVLRCRSMEMASPEQVQASKDQLLVRMLAAPVNPSDINQIQGVYPIRPTLPAAIGGNEGVAEVVAAGTELCKQGWAPGQWLLPMQPNFGTWRTHALADAKQCFRIPNGLPMAHVATLTVNPFSAYRMLKDFVNFGRGECVIFNAANSGVGRALIQLGTLMGIQTIAVIRERPEKEAMKQELRSLGASHVLTEEELRSAEGRRWVETDMKDRIALALNTVGGKSALDLARCLRPTGTLVTYGNMSREPLTLPASLFIFKNIQCRGFWMAHWKETHVQTETGRKQFDEMANYLLNLIQQGTWKSPPVEFVPWGDAKQTEEAATETFLAAIRRSQEAHVGKKQVIQFV